MPADLDPATLALASELGRHGLLAYFMALPLLLVTVATLWVAARRWMWPHGMASQPTALRLTLSLALGFAAVVAAVWVFAELAEIVGAGDRLGGFDVALSAAVGRNLPPVALQAFAWLTHLADPITLTVLCVAVAGALLVRGRWGLALAWVLAVAGNALLNVTLKAVFERVRPLRMHGLEQVSGWSFPSGHSSGSVVAYGMLAYVLTRTLSARWHLSVVMLATALAFSIGCSRVFLQLHYASDVAAGFASGMSWLTLCILACEWRRHWAGAGLGRIG